MKKRYYWRFPYSPFSVYRAHLKIFPIFVRFLKKYDLYPILADYYKSSFKSEMIKEYTDEMVTSLDLSLWNGKKEEWENNFITHNECGRSIYITVLVNMLPYVIK